ncbi:c-type cytochrome [Sphingobacterium sp. SGL-16]|uniref:c-type cytochrome n=1 Tax=Sphingobacterium sp. SGL-16 TaxID=2710883 RepID=UPI0013EDE408|nr:cytochrome c [Sphingobacterium sp. SGL-16]NGM73934.1 cytochrome c [Sphingobacterium sp. SGL-16]
MKFVYTLLIFGLMIIGFAQLSSCHNNNLNIQTAQYAVNGQKLYKIHCQNCHGAKGEGLGKLYPPLTDKNFLSQNRNQLVCIIKNGLDGEIVINGETFNQNMPALSTLNDVDIAYILTYVTTHFGDADSTFTQEEVAQSLKDCK